jgi:hypothetical protein
VYIYPLAPHGKNIPRTLRKRMTLYPRPLILIKRIDSENSQKIDLNKKI